MAIGRWADYSGGRPSGAALKNKGFVGVIRYIGGGSSAKRITAGEYKNLVANGLQVKLVFEIGQHDAETGYNAGVTNARAAMADARLLGIPDTATIFAAADEHMTTAQVSAGVQYVRGFRDVLGLSRTGAYGFSEFVDAVHDAGYASEYWKAGSAPTANERFVTFWQRNQAPTNATVDGVIVDIDDQELALDPTGVDVALTADDIAAIWAYKNTQAGDTVDAHQYLKNAAGNSPAAVWTYDLNSLPGPAVGTAPAGHTLLNDDQIDQDIRSGALANAVAAAVVANQKPVTVDLTALESAITASVTAAVSAGLHGLSLAVSDSAVQAIAAASSTATLAALKAALPA